MIRAAVLAVGNEIHAEDLPLGQASMPDAPAVSGSLEGMERQMIFDALHSTNGHQQQAAAKLGISRRTLSRKLKIYDGGLSEARL